MAHVSRGRENAPFSSVRRCLEESLNVRPAVPERNGPIVRPNVDKTDLEGRGGFYKARSTLVIEWSHAALFDSTAPRIVMPGFVPTLLKIRRSFWAEARSGSPANFRQESVYMSTSIEAEADIIMDDDEHMQAAQAKWERLTEADLRGVRTKRDLTARIEERYSLPHEQASADVEIWAFDKHFATWNA